ncbi:MAG: DUF3775 domain-containing protein [Undibacterium sp.]|nr:DUF3775 domain-containing protein [Opitutaceae bacterium]
MAEAGRLLKRKQKNDLVAVMWIGRRGGGFPAAQWDRVRRRVSQQRRVRRNVGQRARHRAAGDERKGEKESENQGFFPKA